MACTQRFTTPSCIVGAVYLLAVLMGAYAATTGVRRTVTVSEDTNLSATVSPDRR